MFENFENSFFITVQLYTKKEQLRLLSHGFVLKIVEKTIIRKFACNFWKYYRKVGFIIKKNTFYTEILILWIMIIFCSHKNMCYYIQFKFFKKNMKIKKYYLRFHQVFYPLPITSWNIFFSLRCYYLGLYRRNKFFFTGVKISF